jgi:hypothetical protein
MCYKYDIIEEGKGKGKKRRKNDAVSSCYNYCVIGGHGIIAVLYCIDNWYTTVNELSVCLLLVQYIIIKKTIIIIIIIAINNNK